MEIKKNAKLIVDKVLTKGMALLETEQAKKLLESKQVQTAMELGLNMLAKAQEQSAVLKSKIAASLDLVTQEDFRKVQEDLAKMEAKVAQYEAAGNKTDEQAEEDKAAE